MIQTRVSFVFTAFLATSLASAHYVYFDHSPFGTSTSVIGERYSHYENGDWKGVDGYLDYNIGYGLPAQELRGSVGGAGGFASADLVDGSLKAHAWNAAVETGYDAEKEMSFTTTGQTDSWCRMWDTITLGGGAPEARIPLQLDLDGFSSPFGEVYARMYVHPKGEGSQQNYLDWVMWHGKGFQGEVSLDTEILWPLVPTEYEVIIDLETYAPTGSFADFSHTARLKWDLPEGYSYTSASGAFNPGRITPVPEPSSMVALAVGGLAMMRRRARR